MPDSPAVDSSGRVYALSFQHFAGKNAFGARETVVSPTGQLLDSQFISAGQQNTVPPAFAYDPAGGVGVDASDDAWFGWTAAPSSVPQRVDIRRRAADGTLGPLIVASDTTHDVSFCGLGSADDGSALVLSSDGSSGQLLVTPVSSTGVTGAAEVLATKGSNFALGNATMHEFADGDAAFTWVVGEDSGDRTADVEARYRRANGQWSRVFTLSNPAVQNPPLGADPSFRYPDPILTGDSSDNALITWGGSDGTTERVRARRFGWSGPSPTMILSKRGVDAFPTGAALSDGGNAVVGWDVPNVEDHGYDVLQARWLFPGGTFGSTVDAAPRGPRTDGAMVRVVPSGDASSVWLVTSIGGTNPQIRSFASSGSLSARQNVPVPKSGASPPMFTAAGPNGAVAIDYVYGTSGEANHAAGLTIGQPGGTP